MKVHSDRPTFARLPWRASLAALASALIAVLGLIPAPALAITRTQVLSRAHTWVAKKVMYSQRSTFAGYRRDCSGFVSMAWKLGRSYTSRTIHRVARRVPLRKLRAGDAVHTPGHVAIFVKWANKAHTRYIAMEETRWGRPALRHARPLGRGAKGLRYRRIRENPVVVASAPLTGVSEVMPPVLGFADTGSFLTTGSVNATAAASVGSTETAAAQLLADVAPTLIFTSASQTPWAFAPQPSSY